MFRAVVVAGTTADGKVVTNRMSLTPTPVRPLELVDHPGPELRISAILRLHGQPQGTCLLQNAWPIVKAKAQLAAARHAQMEGANLVQGAHQDPV